MTPFVGAFFLRAAALFCAMFCLRLAAMCDRPSPFVSVVWVGGPRNFMKNCGAGAFACQRLIEPRVGGRKPLPPLLFRPCHGSRNHHGLHPRTAVFVTWRMAGSLPPQAEILGRPASMGPGCFHPRNGVCSAP